MQPFERGTRISVLASLDVTGFLSWTCTTGTFTRNEFHRAFVQDILPNLGVWPGPRSIIVLDNASIHRYPELTDACALVGAKLLYLPPYTPQLNPIECGFNIMKSWLVRYCSAALWKLNAVYCIETAFMCCTSYSSVGLAMFAYCGYEVNGVLMRLIKRRMRPRVTTRFPWMRGLRGVRQVESAPYYAADRYGSLIVNDDAASLDMSMSESSSGATTDAHFSGSDTDSQCSKRQRT